MRLHRIRIANFKGVRECHVSFPPTGITIIEGPNEVGKSSLVEAVELLFNFPHDSGRREVKAAQPVDRDVGPEVELELTSGSYHVEYFKRWVRRSETRLSIHRPASATLTGRDAHDRMKQILEETLDMTLFSALRILQGRAVEQGAVGNSTTLLGALDRAAAGSADPDAESTLFGAVEEERLRYFTPAGRVTQERTARRASVSEAESCRDALRGKMAKLESTGEELRRLRSELAEVEPLIADADQQLRDARRDHDSLTAARHQVHMLEAKASAAARIEDHARSALGSRADLLDAVEAEESLLGTLRARRKELAPTLADAASADDAAKDDRDAAESRRQELIAHLRVTEADHRFRSAEFSARLLQERMDQLQAAKEAETAALTVIESTTVSRDDATVVERALQLALEAKAARDAGCPALRVRAVAEGVVRLDGQDVLLEPGQTVEAAVIGESLLEIPGVIEVLVRGGGSAGDLSAAVVQAQENVATVVRELGLDPEDPLGDLRTKISEREMAAADLENARRAKAVALRDLSEEELAAKLADAAHFAQRYPRDRIAAGSIPDTPEAAEVARDAAQRALDDHDGVVAAALARYENTRLLAETSRIAAITADTQVSDCERRISAARDRLSTARDKSSDEVLSEELAMSQAASRTLDEALDTARADLRMLDPDTVETRFENAGQLLERRRHERSELRERVSSLEAVLGVMGADDMAAEIDVLEARALALRAEWDATEARARAAEMLYETFRRHRDAARESYVAPYRDQIERLARLVFGPGVRIQVDPATYEVTHRVLGGASLPYEYLSTGAREQIGVLARLACAMLVNSDPSEDDVGAPVILDDALGYTDKVRLRALAPAFAEAAKHAQVVVLTSTPERYDRVGNATTIRLSAYSGPEEGPE